MCSGGWQESQSAERLSYDSTFHFIPDRLQFCPHTICMSPLDFQCVLRDCSPCSTGILQAFQQRWQVCIFRRQPSNHRHHATVLAFFHGNPSCLFSGRRPHWFQRRTGTLRFRLFTAITMRWSLEFRACQKSHCSFAITECSSTYNTPRDAAAGCRWRTSSRRHAVHEYVRAAGHRFSEAPIDRRLQHQSE